MLLKQLNRTGQMLKKMISPLEIQGIVFSVFLLILSSCLKNNDDSSTASGNGFEIYMTVKPYQCNLNKDYSRINFDTISLSDTPILKYTDLKYYDTTTHKLTLSISHDLLKIGEAGVYGRMFVVTINKQPVYCGFKWPVISSIPCNWVYIEEPYTQLDGLNDNEIIISFSSRQYKDPRLDKRITDRLQADKKIK
jgi:hypothetical protein